MLGIGYNHKFQASHYIGHPGNICFSTSASTTTAASSESPHMCCKSFSREDPPPGIPEWRCKERKSVLTVPELIALFPLDKSRYFPIYFTLSSIYLSISIYLSSIYLSIYLISSIYLKLLLRLKRSHIGWPSFKLLPLMSESTSMWYFLRCRGWNKAVQVSAWLAGPSESLH